MPFVHSLIADVLNPVWSRALVAAGIGVVAALLVSAVVGLVLRSVARRRRWPDRAVRRLRHPFRVLLVVIGAWIGVNVAVLDDSLNDRVTGLVNQVFTIVTILLGAWFATAVVLFLVDLGLGRYRTDVADNATARRIRTQVLVIRRVAIAVIVVVALSSVLLTFPFAQAAGASLLASAGVLSIVAGVAAQSTLGNVVAGVQLAFSGAIRVDDVVIADDQWGRIEEITLTYVVLHVWDDRRVVLPSTYFTTTPFENWTRTGSQLMQSVDFDLDWRVDPAAMREEMHRVLARTELWDGRVAVLQVTDAIEGFVHVRVLVTAKDAPTLFDLRCFVREEMIRWLHEQAPEALPRTRVLMVEPERRDEPEHADSSPQRDRALFSGDPTRDRRARDFTGPIETHGR